MLTLLFWFLFGCDHTCADFQFFGLKICFCFFLHAVFAGDIFPFNSALTQILPPFPLDFLSVRPISFLFPSAGCFADWTDWLNNK